MPSVHGIVAALVTTLCLLPSTDAKFCPPLGAVLPPPRSPGKSDAVGAAIEKLTATLDSKFDAAFNASGVSIGVKSIHESEKLFSYHFTPPVLSGVGTDTIDDQTIYRVGSISKMMPALAALQSDKIDMDASILKYIPQLANATLKSSSNRINTVSWKDVTVRSLASHMSGLATDSAFDLAVIANGPWADMGLPSVPKGQGPSCSGLPGTQPCSKTDLIADLNQRPPVFSTFQTPVYSNVGYALLGMVIESATGQPLKDVFQQNIFSVAGMNSSSFDGPVDSFAERGFVPRGESTTNITLGVYEAAGGMFSNTEDLINFSEAILSNRLLPASQTRAWMKPEVHTSSLGFSVGASWEILRSNTITSDNRTIDIYTKSGDLGLYHGLMGLVPDYDIVLTVLTGGPEVSLDPNARTKIFSVVLQSLLPAIEQAGREEASSATCGFTGTYKDEKTNSSVTIKMDAGPGLTLTDFTVRGFDVLHHMPFYSLNALESGLDSPGVPHIEARMFPTGLSSGSNGAERAEKKNGTSETAWRAVFDTTTDADKEQLDADIFSVDGSCDSWFGFDRSSYNYQGLAEFVFQHSENGAVSSIANPAFDVTLVKVR